MMMLFVVPTMAVLFAALLLLPMRRTQTVHTGVKKRVFANLGVFMVAALLLVALSSGVSAEAAPAAAEAAAAASGSGMGFIAAALAPGLSCLGAGIAIASTAPAAIGAFSEDPKAFGKAMIFVVLGEGVALYGLLISILIINKL